MTEEQTAEALLALSMPPGWAVTRTGPSDVAWARWSDGQVTALVGGKAVQDGFVEVVGLGCTVFAPVEEARAAFDHVIAWLDRPVPTFDPKN